MSQPQHLARTASMWRAHIVLLLVAVLSVLGVGVVSPERTVAAQAGAIVLDVPDGQVIGEGTARFSMTYDTGRVSAGETVVLHLDGLFIENVALGAGDADAIASIAVDKAAGTLTFTFKDPLPSAGKQGVIGVTLSTGAVEKSEQRTVSWWLENQSKTTSTVTVREQNDQSRTWNQSDAWKSVDRGGSLSSYITVSDGKVSVSSDIIGKPVPFSVTLRSMEGVTNQQVVDTITAPFSFVANSFSGALTTWDADGYNKAVSTVALSPTINGTTATIPVTIPAGGELVMSYAVTIANEADRLKLQEQFQAEYDKLLAAEHGGSYSYSLKNIAETPIPTPWNPSVPKTVEVSDTVGTVNVADPDPTDPNTNPGLDSKGVSKTASPASISLDKGFEAKKNDVGLYDIPDQVISYTLAIDYDTLTRNRAVALNSPVVIEDTLPAGAVWSIGDSLELSDGTKLALATIDQCAVWSLSQSGHERTFCIDGTRLVANIGTVNADVSLVVTATITALAGDPYVNSQTAEEAWVVLNTAQFVLNGGWNWTTAKTTVVIPPTNEGVHDSSVFDKSSGFVNGGTVELGKTTTVKYELKFFTKTIGDLSRVVISDPLDTSVFDLSAEKRQALLDGLIVYSGWWPPLTQGVDYTAEIDDQGVLSVRLTQEGIATYKNANTYTSDPFLRVAFNAETLPFTEKKTVTISNTARIDATTGETLYWSETTQTATSWGDEAEYSKQVRDLTTSSWADSVRAPIASNGTLENTSLVYRITYTPHGNFGSSKVAIIPLRDILPEGSTFVSFIDAARAFDVTPTGQSTQRDVGGNLEAVYEAPTAQAPAGTVVLRQKEGTKLNSSTPISVYFVLTYPGKVVEGEPILNTTGTTTTITPGDRFPLSISKVDSTNPSAVITDHTARFIIRNGQGVPVLGDTSVGQQPVFVDGGFLRTWAPDGNTIVNVTVPTAGSYTVEEQVAPAGYVKSAFVLRVSVDSSGISKQAVFENEPRPEDATTPITIVKKGLNCDTDQAECTLAGAEFALFDVDPFSKGATPLEGGVSLKDGGDGATFTTEALAFDTVYWLVETKAPKGHELLATPIKFTISKESGIQLDDSTAGLASVSSTSGTSDKLVLEVKDPTRVDLPAAGGRGFIPFALAGLALMVAAAAYSLSTSRIRLARRRA